MLHSSQRQALLEEHVAREGFAGIERLAGLCGVSPQTIRRDIVELSRQGRVVRLRGGAGAVAGRGDFPFAVRRKKNVAAKQRIGELLAAIIPDRATLFIGGGTTMEISGQQLVQKEGLFVMTTNLHVALSLQRCRNSTILVPHGEVQLGTHSLVGSTIIDSLSQYAMDICLISAAAVHGNGDFYEYSHAIADSIRAMKKYARRIILAVDSGKFTQDGVVRVGNIKEVSVFVTDARPPRRLCEQLREAGVELVCPQVPAGRPERSPAQAS